MSYDFLVQICWKEIKKKVRKFVYEHGRGISIDYRLNFWNIREERIVVTIEEAQNIIYDKTLVRCIILGFGGKTLINLY